MTWTRAGRALGIGEVRAEALPGGKAGVVAGAAMAFASAAVVGNALLRRWRPPGGR